MPKLERWSLVLFVVLISAGACLGQTTTPATEPTRAPASQPARVLKSGDRILFIGDSITGLGDRDVPTQPKNGGYVQLIREALKKAHPDEKYEVVTLGASGSTVGAWNEFFRMAADPKQKPFFTDVPGNEVKATLAKNWDVVVIMLGMNDVLQPAVNDDKESLANWTASYAKLIQTVRDRLHPRVVALGQCTMATEDPNSAMNKFIDKLNENVAKLAEKENCVFLPTNEAYRTVFENARFRKCDFHVMYDHIHPNTAGQIAIADGMLKVLSLQTEQYFRKLAIVPMEKHLGANGLGWRLFRKDELRVPKIEDRALFYLDVNQKPIRIVVPTDWSSEELHVPDVIDFSYAIEGSPSLVSNVVRVIGDQTHGGKEIVIRIPAPWLIAAGPIHIWREHQFDDKAARTAVDDAIEAGKDFTSKDIDVAWETTSVKDYPVDKNKKGKLTWHRFFPSVDYTGSDAPGNVDFWSVSYPHTFETGYAARWVWSDKDRPVRLEASSKGFTRQTYLQVWLNGKKEYSGQISDEKDMKKEWRTTLKKGWNCTAFRCCHITYFFQSELEILPVDKDTLEDLRFSVVPKTADSPAPK